jgi:hypothetical protein
MWFYAMYLMGSTRCRISAKQVQREIGVTYKTAWRMFKQIRSILPKDLRLEGPVGIDETDFGGKRRKVRREFGQVGKRGRSPKGATTKTPIIGSSAAYGRKNSRKHRIGNLLGMVHEHIILDSTNSVEGFVR